MFRMMIFSGGGGSQRRPTRIIERRFFQPCFNPKKSSLMLALFRGEVFQAAAYQRHDGVLDQITAFLCLLLLLLVYSSDNQMVRLMTMICIIRIDVESLKTFQLTNP